MTLVTYGWEEELNSTAATVVLPCPPDQFRDFIAGLLGRAQTIETLVPGPFELRKENVENLFHLVAQRVTSQNEATLVQFTARIVYDDSSSVLLNSLPDFLAYNEVKPLVSTGLHLSWMYLIKFQNKQFPEKQSIQVSFDTNETSGTVSNVAGVQVFLASGRPMQIRIEHTDRTWGADIEALLRGHLEMLLQEIGPARRFSNQFSGWIGLAAGVCAAAFTLTTTYHISADFALRQAERLDAIKKGATPESIEGLARQIDYLSSLLASGIWSRFSLFAAILLVVLLVGSVVLSFIVSEMAHVNVPSFLLLTSRSETARLRSKEAMRKSWFRLSAAFAGAMLLGVLSNSLFYLALKFLGLPS